MLSSAAYAQVQTQAPAFEMVKVQGGEFLMSRCKQLSTKAEEVNYRGYEVGELIYWPPRHSLVIMYAQNAEQFSMQSVGRLDQSVESLPREDFKATLSLGR